MRGSITTYLIIFGEELLLQAPRRSDSYDRVRGEGIGLTGKREILKNGETYRTQYNTE